MAKPDSSWIAFLKFDWSSFYASSSHFDASRNYWARVVLVHTLLGNLSSRVTGWFVQWSHLSLFELRISGKREKSISCFAQPPFGITTPSTAALAQCNHNFRRGFDVLVVFLNHFRRTDFHVSSSHYDASRNYWALVCAWHTCSVILAAE